MKIKKLLTTGIIGIMTLIMTACSDADVASQNLSQAADNFEINRRIVFYNGITDSYMLTIEGLCSLGNADDRSKQLTVTCKVGADQYKKTFSWIVR